MRSQGRRPRAATVDTYEVWRGPTGLLVAVAAKRPPARPRQRRLGVVQFDQGGRPHATA